MERRDPGRLGAARQLLDQERGDARPWYVSATTKATSAASWPTRRRWPADDGAHAVAPAPVSATSDSRPGARDGPARAPARRGRAGASRTAGAPTPRRDRSRKASERGLVGWRPRHGCRIAEPSRRIVSRARRGPAGRPVAPRRTRPARSIRHGVGACYCRARRLTRLRPDGTRGRARPRGAMDSTPLVVYGPANHDYDFGDPHPFTPASVRPGHRPVAGAGCDAHSSRRPLPPTRTC